MRPQVYSGCGLGLGFRATTGNESALIRRLLLAGEMYILHIVSIAQETPDASETRTRPEAGTTLGPGALGLGYNKEILSPTPLTLKR